MTVADLPPYLAPDGRAARLPEIRDHNARQGGIDDPRVRRALGGAPGVSVVPETRLLEARKDRTAAPIGKTKPQRALAVGAEVDRRRVGDSLFQLGTQRRALTGDLVTWVGGLRAMAGILGTGRSCRIPVFVADSESIPSRALAH